MDHFRVPTPVQVLTSMGESLVNAGCIVSYAPPTQRGLSVVTKQNVTLNINCRYDPNPQMLTFTSEVCTDSKLTFVIRSAPYQINQRTARRGTAVAVQAFLDYFRENIGSGPQPIKTSLSTDLAHPTRRPS